MSLDLTNDKSTLVQVIAWCRQATSHYLNQCWPRSPTLYGVTRPQCNISHVAPFIIIWTSWLKSLHLSCLLNSSVSLTTKKSRLHMTGLCWGGSTSRGPSQRANDAKGIFMLWQWFWFNHLDDISITIIHINIHTRVGAKYAFAFGSFQAVYLNYIETRAYLYLMENYVFVFVSLEKKCVWPQPWHTHPLINISR